MPESDNSSGVQSALVHPLDLRIAQLQESIANLRSAISEAMQAGQSYTLFGSHTKTAVSVSELRKQLTHDEMELSYCMDIKLGRATAPAIRRRGMKYVR